MKRLLIILMMLIPIGIITYRVSGMLNKASPDIEYQATIIQDTNLDQVILLETRQLEAPFIYIGNLQNGSLDNITNIANLDCGLYHNIASRTPTLSPQVLKITNDLEHDWGLSGKQFQGSLI